MKQIVAGKVSLVGAGPGDPELLTLKALKAMEAADAVVYDRLVSEEILALLPHGIPRFFAGKSCQQKAMTQEEINQLLITLAITGQRVVRLKGGDPFLFGRGGEEALELARHHIPFEIIPGITSAQGCSAALGIPLTHRGMSGSVRFITGHRMEGDAELQLNWQSLADVDTTLVIYMGLANFPFIASQLIAHGLPANTPAAAIANGTTPRQAQCTGTLGNLAETMRGLGFEPPTLIIIGKVAQLAKRLQVVTSRISGQETETVENLRKTFT